MNLNQLGWNAEFESAFEQLNLTDAIPARVAREDRGGYIVYAAGRAWRATLRGKLRYESPSFAELPAVGDWVAAQPRRGEEAATIVAVVPRRTAVVRRQAGTRTAPQVVAANVDTLFICCGLDQDFNVRRIERYLSVAYESGTAPVVLLSKADLCSDDEVAARVAETEAAAIGVPVIPLSVIDGRGVAAAASWLPAGTTAALVGSSGVGKSSLINALLGQVAMAIGATRAHDGRGRHTTTHRQLLLLPGGGVMIDTPGMRELQLWGDESQLGESFGDIAALAGECRFRDCGHESEPGCAVQAALVSGQLAPERLESYRKQLRELRHLERKEDPALARADRDRWKVVHKAARKRMTQKYRYH